MIGGNFGLQKIGAAGLATCERFPDSRLLGIGQPACHRPGRYENHRKMTKGQRPDHQARHDLVADTKAQRRIIDAMRQAYGGGHRDHIAAHQ